MLLPLQGDILTSLYPGCYPGLGASALSGRIGLSNRHGAIALLQLHAKAVGYTDYTEADAIGIFLGKSGMFFSFFLVY